MNGSPYLVKNCNRFVSVAQDTNRLTFVTLGNAKLTLLREIFDGENSSDDVVTCTYIGRYCMELDARCEDVILNKGAYRSVHK